MLYNMNYIDHITGVRSYWVSVIILDMSLEDMLAEWRLDKKPTDSEAFRVRGAESYGSNINFVGDLDGIFSRPNEHKKCGEIVVPVTGKWVSKEPHCKVTGSSYC